MTQEDRDQDDDQDDEAGRAGGEDREDAVAEARADVPGSRAIAASWPVGRRTVSVLGRRTAASGGAVARQRRTSRSARMSPTGPDDALLAGSGSIGPGALLGLLSATLVPCLGSVRRSAIADHAFLVSAQHPPAANSRCWRPTGMLGRTVIGLS